MRWRHWVAGARPVDRLRAVGAVPTRISSLQRQRHESATATRMRASSTHPAPKRTDSNSVAHFEQRTKWSRRPKRMRRERAACDMDVDEARRWLRGVATGAALARCGDPACETRAGRFTTRHGDRCRDLAEHPAAAGTGGRMPCSTRCSPTARPNSEQLGQLGNGRLGRRLNRHAAGCDAAD